jgi:CMP/dCMP kinase
VVITIDGPAGAGKSTVARAVADRLGYMYVDTGLMYRELTAVAMERGVDPGDGDALAALVGEAPAGPVDLRSEAVSARVSAVSRHPQVRQRMRARQRERALVRDAVLEGRDTGSRVCPDAEVKVYLTASLEARAARRAVDLGLATDEVGRTIAARDRGDAEQLAPAPDAHVIDTSGLTVAEAVDAVVRLVEAAA